jgi:hypothetical protein
MVETVGSPSRTIDYNQNQVAMHVHELAIQQVHDLLL